jgi:hypothetical protein
MPWARFDEEFPAHRKVRPLTDAAFRLHVSAICWSNRNLTDGLIPDDELPYVSDVKNPEKATGQLELRGLWERTPSGWLIHDYLEFNPPAAFVEAERQKKAAAGRKGAQARWHSG